MPSCQRCVGLAVPSPAHNRAQLKEIFPHVSPRLSYIPSVSGGLGNIFKERSVINVNHRYAGANTDMNTHNFLVPGQFVKHVD